MAHINLTINGRNFGMECDDGQEQRVIDLGNYVDAKVKTIAAAGAASNENHLLVLTSLMLADEIHDLRDSLSALGEHVESKDESDKQEEMVSDAINSLAERIELIAKRIQTA
ncbi:MAG: cell division protein ZapA [Micavibrio sp.]|nr:cell division protein ZapA [Micavibrio sp.]|tara:strand:- start:3238 stop:3573 length:336 start_codon:yes stop_codon:yes gene_type:complete